MSKNEVKKQRYVSPRINVVDSRVDGWLLSSPLIRPGGGGGNISVVPPTQENDEEISGARTFEGWQ